MLVTELGTVAGSHCCRSLGMLPRERLARLTAGFDVTMTRAHFAVSEHIPLMSDTNVCLS